MKDVLWTLLETISNLFESFLCIHFIITSFDGKTKKISSKAVYIIGTLCMTAVVSVLNGLTLYEGLFGLFYVIFFFIFSLIFLRGTIQKKIFVAILTNICLISTAAISGNILSVVFDNHSQLFVEQTFERFIYMVIGISLAAYIFAILSRLTNSNKEALSAKEWVLILSVLIISSAVIAVIHIIILDDEIKDKHIYWLMLSELGIILINILCLYITVNLSETHKREEKLILENKRVEYNQKYAQAVKEQYEQTRRLRHDMKQYCTALDGLIADKKYSEARQLISENYEHISHTEVVIDVGNDFINALLNAKLTSAKSLGIDVICSVEKNLLGIESADLCSLIGNLLDNAIEAAQACEPEKRSIELNISASGGHLNIVVRNSIRNSVIKDNPRLSTTKANPSEHGFGIKTIKFIVKKYGGTVDFYEEDLTFICHIVIYTNQNALTR